MKIVMISTSDQAGGAAIACLRLASALAENGHEVRMLVMNKQGVSRLVEEVKPGRKRLDALLKHAQYFWNKRCVTATGYEFSGDPWLGYGLASHPAVHEADVINLHWVNHGYLSVDNVGQLLSLNKPILWHLHDFWPVTGGCHYPDRCNRYQISCGNCPALQNPHPADLAWQQFEKKITVYSKNPPVFVAASAWLADCVAKASLLTQTGASVIHIPNPIDSADYYPADKSAAKKQLQLNPKRKHLLFAAMNTSDPRKGFDLLVRGLKALKEQCTHDIELLIAGKCTTDLTAKLPYPSRLLGSLGPANMRQAYQAADVFVIPSLQDNLPNTVLESLHCGTPVAGFTTGGIPEMVSSGINGYLAKEVSDKGLAEAIDLCLATRFSTVHSAPHLQAFTPAQVAVAYERAFKAHPLFVG
jgi:glycosyltransferase involved in cell wall biosynthesis